jgi:hypothetical protein
MSTNSIGALMVAVQLDSVRMLSLIVFFLSAAIF